MAYKKPPEITRRPGKGRISQLPAEGPDQAPPKWPLDRQRAGETALWKEVWSLPQAAAWHQLRCERLVARYVRMVLRAENMGGDGSGVTYQQEVRRLENELGLSPRAMHLLNWRVVETMPEAPVDLVAYRSAVGD